MKELHWETASHHQKTGYLLSKLGMKPEVSLRSFGKRVEYHLMVTEEMIDRKSVIESCEMLRHQLLMVREGLLETDL